MLPDPDQLRVTTKKAVEEATLRREQKLVEIKKQEERQRQRDVLFAEHVLQQVASKCEKEAENGRSHAVIMSLDRNRDYSSGDYRNTLGYQYLKGPGAIVWNELQKAKLNPQIEFWHDGVGYDSGYNIIVKWDTK